MSTDPAPTRALVAHASRHGSTREVAETVARVLRERGLSVDELPAREVEELAGFGLVVLGGALYVGRLHPDARAFLAAHREGLAERRLAVFALGPKTLEPADVAGSRAQLDAALARIQGVEPDAIAIFGGVIRPERLRFPLSRMQGSDARDWDAIEAWAREIAALAPAREPAPSVAAGPVEL